MTQFVYASIEQRRPLRPIRRYRPNSIEAEDVYETQRQTAPPTPINPKIPEPTPQPVPSGQFYQVVSPPEDASVMPRLGQELIKFFEQFAQANGFSEEQPLLVAFGRGTMGLHRYHRAADIYSIGDKGIDQWLNEWNTAMRTVSTTQVPEERDKIVSDEKAKNLGYKLYKALQDNDSWIQPLGYPVQLFGPWTRIEGPHKAISDRMLYLHRDHIHVAK